MSVGVRRQGPLAGLRILEFAGIGPTPFCGMLLSDLGADVVRIDRPGEGQMDRRTDVASRGRRSVMLDLKAPGAIDACLALARAADGLIEGFRPGVMERLGLGPDVVLSAKPSLVYGRMTGWGQTGPYAQSAGHDINYIAIAGALAAIGPAAKPQPPLNLVGDFGGGALYLALGVVSAVLHARQTGRGQVVDCAMSEGAASLMSVFYGLSAAGEWGDARQENVLDGGAPFYDTYQCSDGQWVAIGPLEPQFYAELVERLGLDPELLALQSDRDAWPRIREALATAFAGRSRDEWCASLMGTDACFAPVLGLREAPHDPHNRAREAFVEIEGVIQPAPTPRFSETPSQIQGGAPHRGAHSRSALADWGVGADAIAGLERSGALLVGQEAG